MSNARLYEVFDEPFLNFVASHTAGRSTHNMPMSFHYSSILFIQNGNRLESRHIACQAWSMWHVSLRCRLDTDDAKASDNSI